jgi:hypothetical protein
MSIAAALQCRYNQFAIVTQIKHLCNIQNAHATNMGVFHCLLISSYCRRLTRQRHVSRTIQIIVLFVLALL